MNDVHDLPDDPALLKRLLVEQDALIDRIKQEAAEQMEALRLSPGSRKEGRDRGDSPPLLWLEVGAV